MAPNVKEIEDKEVFNYHKDQLDRINTMSIYAPTFQIKDVDNKTKWMSLTKSSAQVLATWLKEKYGTI